MPRAQQLDSHREDHRTGLSVRVTAIVGALVLLGAGVIALITLRDEASSPSSAAGDVAGTERFIVDGMNVDDAIQHSDGSSELYLNTPHGDPDSALPAIIIATGRESSTELSQWPRSQRTAHVSNKLVGIHSLDGDPLGTTWTTLHGTYVSVIGEGFTVDEFSSMLSELRLLTQEEWTAVIDEAQNRSPDDIPLLPVPDSVP
jgi:hypothetical protein